MRSTISNALLAFTAMAASTAAQADVRITEFMYQGANSGNREFFELTNISNGAVDITGWTYNDNDPNNPVAFGSSFGLLGANESIILTEMSEAAFRSYWGLSSSVRIFSIGGNSNLGSSDSINIYSSSAQTLANLVDSVTYSGTTRGISRNRPVNATGSVANSLFVDSIAGDAYGSTLAPTGPDRDLANPGKFPSAVPEPASWALMIGGFMLVGASTRRTRKVSFA